MSRALLSKVTVEVTGRSIVGMCSELFLVNLPLLSATGLSSLVIE